MNKFLAVFGDTLLEIRAKKIFYLYWAVAFFLCLIFFLIPDIKIQGMNIFEEGAVPPEVMNEGVSMVFSELFGFMIFLMVFGSAGLIPAFVTKGRIELTLSKPIDRYRLILMKFASVYIIMCAILAVSMILIWLVVTYRLSGVSWNFFLGLLFSFAQFFAVYAIVAVLGLASNSAALAIMGYFIVRVVSILLASREVVYELIGESVWKNVLDTIYHIMPKIGEMTLNYTTLIQGKGLTYTYPFYSTMGISVVLILIMMLIFKRRDY